MASREERISIFNDTIALCHSHHVLQHAIAHSIEHQRFYSQTSALLPINTKVAEKPAALVLSKKRTFEAAKPYAAQGKRVCVLNFASSVTPGGGVTRGASAQEESLCRISTLYPSISDQLMQKAFYTYHKALIREGKMGRENRDDCIYTPDVIAFREDDFECGLMPEHEWFRVDVITCAAPDLRASDDPYTTFKPNREALVALFCQRLSRVLNIAASHQAQVMILGAFGCGAFLNPPSVVVEAINRVLADFRDHFETIEFAVFSASEFSRNYQAFQSIAGVVETESPPQ